MKHIVGSSVITVSIVVLYIQSLIGLSDALMSIISGGVVSYPVWNVVSPYDESVSSVVPVILHTIYISENPKGPCDEEV